MREKTPNEDLNSPAKFYEFKQVFEHVSMFGRYQQALYYGCNCIILAWAFQYGSLLFSFGTPRFHCEDTNTTCKPNKCCNNCSSYAFDGPFESVVNEWNLLCDRRYIAAIIQSMFFVGQLAGSTPSGMASDAFGRKYTMLISTGLFSAFCIGASFANSYILLGCLEFLVGFFLVAGLLTEYTYSIELAGPKKRTMAGSLVEVFWCSCLLIQNLLAYFNREWRYLLLAASLPGFVFVLFWRCIPRSPRWLIAHGKLDEAQAVLNRYGSKKPIDQEILRELIINIRQCQIEKQKMEKKYTFVDLFRTPKMRKFSIIMGYNWFTVAMSDMGFVLFMSALPGNVYQNVAITLSLQMVLLPITWYLLRKCGRRLIHGLAMFISGVLCLVIMAIPDEYPTLATAFALIGKSVLSVGWLTIYLVGSELFPTTIRNTALGMCSTFQRCGALMAPYIVMLSQLPGLSIYLPVTIFGVVAIVASISTFFIPETLYAPMTQTIEEAEYHKDSYSFPCCGKPPEGEEERQNGLLYMEGSPKKSPVSEVVTAL